MMKATPPPPTATATATETGETEHRLEGEALIKETLINNIKVQKRQLDIDTCKLVSCVFVFICISGMALHLRNRYPEFYTRNELYHQKALKIAAFCKTYNYSPPPELKCEHYEHWAEINLSAQTVEDVWLHFVDDMNFFKYIGCSTGSVCEFVMLHSITSVFSSFATLSLVLCVAFASWLYWMIKNPYQHYNLYTAEKEKLVQQQLLENQKKRDDIKKQHASGLYNNLYSTITQRTEKSTKSKYGE